MTPPLLVAAAACLCVCLLPALCDASFLAPCLWRFQRAGGAGLLGVPAGGPRSLATDADACKLLCRAPLAASAMCQRCCRGAEAAPWASWGHGQGQAQGVQIPLTSLLAAMGWPGVPSPGATISQLLGMKPGGAGTSSGASGTWTWAVPSDGTTTTARPSSAASSTPSSVSAASSTAPAG